MADPDLELRRGLVFVLLVVSAFLPSVISSFSYPKCVLVSPICATGLIKAWTQGKLPALTVWEECFIKNFSFKCFPAAENSNETLAYINLNHKNYNFLDCDCFKKLPFFTCQVVIRHFVIGQFVIGQFNKPITFKVVV